MDNEERTLFPTRLRYLRQKNGLSQKMLAEKLHYGYTAISNYESGRNQPGLRELIMLAKVFDVSVDFLVGNDRDKTLSEKEIFYGDGMKNFVNFYLHHEEFRKDMDDIINGLMKLYLKASRQEL